MLWWMTAFAGTPCEQTSSSAEVQQLVDDAIRSSANGSVPILDPPRRAIHCLGELVHPDVAGAWLRLEGVAASRSGDPARATAAFQSALTVAPGHPLDPLLAPAGSDEAQLYARAYGLPLTSWTTPDSTRLVFVNGAFGTVVPDGLAILQTIGSDSTIAWTRIATGPDDFGPPPDVDDTPRPPPMPAPVESPPPVEVAPPVEAAPPALPPPRPQPAPAVALPAPPVPRVPRPLDPDSGSRTRGSGTLTALGIGLLAGGAAAFTGAAISHSRYDKAPTRPRRLQTNALSGVAVGLSVVGAGITFTGLILPRGKRQDEPEGLY